MHLRSITMLAGAAVGAALGPAALASHAARRPVATRAGAACAAAPDRAFDFFVGDWDTYDVAGPDTVVARNRVAPMLDGCAIREVYEQRDGLRGESFSAPELGDQPRPAPAARRAPRGQSYGAHRRGAHPGGGATSLLRGVWYRVPGGVRETATRSRDAGATWTPVFDIVFRPHPRDRSP